MTEGEGEPIMFMERWKAISARIDGIESAATLMTQYLQVRSTDSHGVERHLGKMSAATLDGLVAFGRDFAGALPAPVTVRITEFATERRSLFDGAKSDADSARSASVLIVALKTELAYLLTDQQEQLHTRTERAFNHLGRVLAANEREREVWRAAYDGAGETACEKLGGAHLLAHGIFAFKAHAQGGRTDLVFAEPLDVGEVVTTGSGLVLTEWKVAEDGDAEAKFRAARTQAGLYRDGVLAGVELATYRYLVAVSLKPLRKGLVPPDATEGHVIYRHLNIVIDPPTPSAAARSA